MLPFLSIGGPVGIASIRLHWLQFARYVTSEIILSQDTNIRVNPISSRKQVGKILNL